MNFSEALGIVKSGGKVRRGGWDELGMDWTLELAVPVLPDGRAVAPQLLCRGASGEMVQFTGGTTDLLAEDWETV